jgi:hypothetical protein
VSDSNVIKLTQPGVFTDSLTEILRSGARALLTQAVEAEVAEFLAKHADLKTETGQQREVPGCGSQGMAWPTVGHLGWAPEAKFAVDSPLEGPGFEPSVPRPR